MFYMEDYLTVKTGEEIFGTIGMRPNAKNNVRRGRRGWGGGTCTCSGSQGLYAEVSLSIGWKWGSGDPATVRLNPCPPGAPVLSTRHPGVGPEAEPPGFLASWLDRVAPSAASGRATVWGPQSRGVV